MLLFDVQHSFVSDAVVVVVVLRVLVADDKDVLAVIKFLVCQSTDTHIY